MRWQNTKEIFIIKILNCLKVVRWNAAVVSFPKNWKANKQKSIDAAKDSMADKREQAKARFGTEVAKNKAKAEEVAKKKAEIAAAKAAEEAAKAAEEAAAESAAGNENPAENA